MNILVLIYSILFFILIMKLKENKHELCIKELQNHVDSNLHTIGGNLKRFRLELGMSQSDVAFYIFSDKSLISALERGVYHNITLLTLFKFCKLFDKTIEDFLKP